MRAKAIGAMGLVAIGAAMLGGCAVYPTPYGPAVAPAPVAVAPAPVYVGPPAVVVRPAPYYYGGHGYYGRRYYRGGW
ncbi:hypothetical protein D3C81_1068060 [compost metagenome]|uniref:Lipoprotein n=2 Tax=Cupriavidus campinensis TaxID=151783 RepID=A0AAE9HYH2_9BURK|nr:MULTISPECIES: hypothetical protein [Cupriavidus]URF03804.1 hypothetical protein M5D45_15065 [Cupriavidus campinensis]CAG2135730.1 hypothetical protein LMG19282_01100 [Cupriavidus campinensis]